MLAMKLSASSAIGGLTENSFINIRNKSHSITAQLIVPEGKPCEGVVLSQGGFAGGWILYVREGRLRNK
jgi:arylsulfatase